MAFPSSPTNGQTTVLNGVQYTYSSATGSWARTSVTSTATTALYANAAYSSTGFFWANGAAYSSTATSRIAAVTSASTITPTSATADQYEVTALAVGTTIAAPSGTPVDGQKLILRIKDNGTARALNWTTTSGGYRAVGTTLPSTTTLSKVLYVGLIYNSQDTYWDVVALAQQA